MKPSYLFLVWGICCCTTAFGQKKLQLHDYKFSEDIVAELDSGTLRQTSAAYYYTYIGDYQKAIEQYELALDWGLDSISQIDSLLFLDYQPINAFSYLAEQVQLDSIVIISEAHQKPQHRTFTKQLLQTLYNQGFRYFGLETLLPSFQDSTKFLFDQELNARKYPLNSPMTGYYTREAQMADLVRQAIAIGYEVFAYERMSSGERDYLQAKNIMKFIENRPPGKVLIQGGWYHAIESNYPKPKDNNWMAYHLKQMGKNPLTIYQDALTEKGALPASPLFDLVQTDQISVLVNAQGQVFNGFDDQKHFDILLYHPPTKYKKGRPSWLYEQAGHRFVPIEKKRITADQYPVLVKAIFQNEEKNAVPLDIIELKSAHDPKELVLRKGKYWIIITSKNGQEVTYEKEVDTP